MNQLLEIIQRWEEGLYSSKDYREALNAWLKRADFQQIAEFNRIVRNGARNG